MQLNLIKGVGPKTLKKLENLNIYTVEDLLTYYPYDYLILKKTDLNQNKVVIDGIIETIPQLYFFGKHKDRMSFNINTQGLLLSVSIFNRGYLKNKLNVGDYVTIIGEYDKTKSKIIASDIRLGKLPNTPIIEPKYHSNKQITSKEIHKLILNSFDYINKLNIIIPDYIQEKYKLKDKHFSVLEIHKPTNENNLKQAINYLKYEELLIFMLKINFLKLKHKNINGIKRNISNENLNNVIDKLPFKLTPDQTNSVIDIFNDLNSEKRMNRLLQGDVGSGKTIVAFLSLYINYLSGYQGALMAPTEVLAIQHYNNIKNLFPDINIQLLTGKQKQSEKREILNNIEIGNIDIIIGTHALISDNVKYKNLGLVITDEQHRFGVTQRSSLKNKGVLPDILYLSATPIPRTYALTIYGDMDISSIKTMPNGRKQVNTLLYKNDDIKEVLTIMLEQIKLGHQVYVIAPLIEDDEENSDSVKSLQHKMEKAFSKICNIGILHGKMKSEEKDKIMTDFKNNQIQILISTTVIEVGIDVKNATAIIMFDSYRFGLSQLHQLRGRVGRNDYDNYCILISDHDTKRLEIMTKTTDGFKISEEDFKLRGSGDLFGIKQSGDMCFKLADIKQDFNILKCAKIDSEQIIKGKNYSNGIKHLIDTLDNLS